MDRKKPKKSFVPEWDRENLEAMEGLQIADPAPLVDLLLDPKAELHTELRRWLAYMLAGQPEPRYRLRFDFHKDVSTAYRDQPLRFIRVGRAVHKMMDQGMLKKDACREAGVPEILSPGAAERDYARYRQIYLTLKERDDVNISPDLSPLTRRGPRPKKKKKKTRPKLRVVKK